jgi:membrane-associated phospholipid phosphatase
MPPAATLRRNCHPNPTSVAMGQWLQDVLFQVEPIVWVQQFFGLGHPLPFRLVDLLASTWGVLFAIALSLWVWGREDAYALSAIVIVEALINLGLNQLLHVPRPSAPEIVKYEHIGLGSFPSGHVFTVTVLWGLLWARNRVPFWLAALLILAVAVGRLYLGVHYLADVLAGVVLGALLVWAFRALWPPVHGWLTERSYAFFVGAGLLGVAALGAGLFLLGSRSHFMYNAAAIFAGGVIALLVEYGAVRFRPTGPDRARAFSKLVIGLLGIVPLLGLDRLTGENSLWIGAALAFLGALWALLAAPAIFQWWGWGKSGSLQRPHGQSAAPTLQSTGWDSTGIFEGGPE